MPSKKRLFFVFFSIASLIGGLAAGLILVPQPQRITPKASTPLGTAYVSINPASKTVSPGESFDAEISFTTGGYPISAITVQIDYNYYGSEPPLIAGITPNLNLTQAGDWNFPIKTFSAEDGHAAVKIAAVNISQSGYIAAGDTLLATLNFTASDTVGGSITAEFNAEQSKITRRDTAEDILMTPSDTGTYIVAVEDYQLPTIPVNPTATRAPTYEYVPPTAAPTLSDTLPQTGNAVGTIGLFSFGLAAAAIGFLILFVF